MIRTRLSTNFYCSLQCIMKLKNTSSSPVEFVELTVDSLLEPNLQQQIIQWSQETVQNQLPLTAGATIDLPLHLFGAANFLVQNIQSANAQGNYYIYLSKYVVVPKVT